MTNYYFGIKITSNTIINIGNSQAMLLNKERSVGKREANYYLGIKITSKLDKKHQSTGNSLSMLLEYKEVIRKKSEKLLFWNKK